MLSWLNQKLDSQWLVTWTLVAFVATLIFRYVISGVGSPLEMKTGRKLVALQLAGTYPVLHWTCKVPTLRLLCPKAPAGTVLSEWQKAGVREDAQRAQLLDFFSPWLMDCFSSC